MSRSSEPPSLIPFIQRQIYVPMTHSVAGPKGLTEVSERHLGAQVLDDLCSCFVKLDIVVAGGGSKGGNMWAKL